MRLSQPKSTKTRGHNNRQPPSQSLYLYLFFFFLQPMRTHLDRHGHTDKESPALRTDCDQHAHQHEIVEPEHIGEVAGQIVADGDVQRRAQHL